MSHWKKDLTIWFEVIEFFMTLVWLYIYRGMVVALPYRETCHMGNERSVHSERWTDQIISNAQTSSWSAFLLANNIIIWIIKFWRRKIRVRYCGKINNMNKTIPYSPYKSFNYNTIIYRFRQSIQSFYSFSFQLSFWVLTKSLCYIKL